MLFFETLRNEYSKYKEKILNEQNLKICIINKRYKKILMITCEHYTHFQCYFNQFMESDLINFQTNFACPLCHREAQIFVPILIQYSDKQTKSHLKGFDFNLIFEYGKQKIKEFQKEHEELLKKNENIEQKNEQEEKNDENDVNNIINQKNIIFGKHILTLLIHLRFLSSLL